MSMTDEKPPERTTDLGRLIIRHMAQFRSEGAWWTSDISRQFRIATDTVRRELMRLERAGLVRRVVTGNPTSWTLNDHVG
jgi:DNA-binding HxlR family transcriptional regulator